MDNEQLTMTNKQEWFEQLQLLLFIDKWTLITDTKKNNGQWTIDNDQ